MSETKKQFLDKAIQPLKQALRQVAHNNWKRLGQVELHLDELGEALKKMNATDSDLESYNDLNMGLQKFRAAHHDVIRYFS